MSIFTVLILLAGVLFVYGAFDFTFGRAQLIGGSKQSQEKILHDKIVVSLHDIGNQIQELIVFDITSDLDEALRKVETLKAKRDKLTDLFEDNTFTSKQKPLKDSYYKIYKPPLDAFIEMFEKAGGYYYENELTEENKNLYSEELQKSSEALIEAHNEHINIVNAKRKY